MNKENEKDDKLILDHEYDGIHELDNPLPGWWLTTFYLTIIFAAVYYVYYQFGAGPTSDKELKINMESIQTLQAKVEDTGQLKTEEGLLALAKDKETLSKGRAEFVVKCAACHGAEGQGVIGPNLTDDYWIHGDGSIATIIKVANEGVLEKVAVYIYSIRGSNPEGAKPPQGEKITN